jgi:hypothetical protein
VQVTLTEDAPPNTDVLIFGVRARAVWLQAPGRLGQWQIPIIATSQQHVDHRVVTVDVAGAPAGPVLELARNPFKPLSIVLHARDLDPTHPLLTVGDVYHWKVGAFHSTTHAPMLSQDLEGQVDDSRAWTDLSVELNVAHADGSHHFVQRTLVLGSVYRLLRDELHQIRPPVRTDGKAKQARLFDHIYRGSFEVRNLEPTALSFTLKRAEWQIVDEELASYGPDIPISLRLDADASAVVDVELDRRTAPVGALGAIIHLFGQTDDGTPVHTSAAFDFVRAPRLFKYKEPPLIGRPKIWDKVTGLVEMHGGDPYVFDAITGGVVRLTNPSQTDGITHEQLWSLDLVRTAAARAGRIAATSDVQATQAVNLSGLAAAIEAPALPRELTKQLIRGGVSKPVPPWLDSIGKRIGLGKLEVITQNIAGVIEGEDCDPDNIPDQVPEFFACQFTGEYKEDIVPGRATNARRGDIILVPGGNGIIGGLLAHVEPLQRYAHCGIMTKNYVELSHSTASPDWLRDHARGVDPLGSTGSIQPTDGFEPNALRFQWPGGVTQSIDAAYGGSEFMSPEGKKYRIAAFNLTEKAFLNGQWTIIPPLVIKPHPIAEYNDPNLRKRLHRVADEVKKFCVTEKDTEDGKQSKTHYRFFCYTNAALALETAPVNGIVPIPAGDSWPGGTVPTVCSSLIWLAARRAGEKLEGPGDFTQPSDIEPNEVLAGAQTDPRTRDGLYFYTEDERSRAAQWLVGYLSDEIYKTAAKEGGWFGGLLNEIFSDMADDCAYQIANTFAFDLADGPEAIDEDRWRNPGPGRAISPDNLMFWDKPQESGRSLWGYFEPLHHFSAHVEVVPITKWRKTSGFGTLKGIVRFEGTVAPGAHLNAGGTMTHASPAGEFSMQVLDGQYDLRANATISEVGHVSANVPVVVKPGETTFVEVNLQRPPDQYRKVTIVATINFRDDEDFPFPDETDTDGDIWEFDLGPWQLARTQPYVRGWGGECRVEAKITVELNFDRSVTVKIDAQLFEGTTENTDERDGMGEKTWPKVPKDQTIPLEPFRITHENEDDTYAEFHLTVTNKAQGAT